MKEPNKTDTGFRAVIDIGSNSFYLIIARITPDGQIEIVYRKRETLRLVDFSKTPHSIMPDEMLSGIVVLKNFATTIELYHADPIITATAAVREATNGNSFLERIKIETGLKARILKANEEAQLIYLAIRTFLKSGSTPVAAIDLGGGSTEIVIGSGEKIEYKKSFAVGAVRCSNLFFPGEVVTEQAVEKCSTYVRDELKPLKQVFTKYRGITAGGCSGTVRSILTYLNLTLDGTNEHPVKSFSAGDVSIILKKTINLKTTAERLRIPAIEPLRADIFIPGLIIINEFMALTQIPKLTYSEFGLREGLLIESLLNSK